MYLLLNLWTGSTSASFGVFFFTWQFQLCVRHITHHSELISLHFTPLHLYDMKQTPMLQHDYCHCGNVIMCSYGTDHNSCVWSVCFGFASILLFFYFLLLVEQLERDSSANTASNNAKKWLEILSVTMTPEF